MTIEISDKMYAILVRLASCRTWDERDQEYCPPSYGRDQEYCPPSYGNGFNDGQITLARTFLDEVEIVHP